MRDAIGMIDLDAVPLTEKDKLMDMIRQDLAGLPDEDQKEIMEIAGDIFTDEELKELFAGDFAEEGGLI